MTRDKYYKLCLAIIDVSDGFDGIVYTLSLDDNYMPIETEFNTDTENCIVGTCIDDVLHDAYTMFESK